jgi:ribonuclease VapC
MVVDTSAIYAILAGEPERERFSRVLATAGSAVVSTATLTECSAVLLGKQVGIAPLEVLEEFIQTYRLKVVPIDEAQWRLATEALRQFGKGRHPARLNICDSFSYALAKSMDAPLLFKGDDFTHTDIRAAL